MGALGSGAAPGQRAGDRKGWQDPRHVAENGSKIQGVNLLPTVQYSRTEFLVGGLTLEAILEDGSGASLGARKLLVLAGTIEWLRQSCSRQYNTSTSTVLVRDDTTSFPLPGAETH